MAAVTLSELPATMRAGDTLLMSIALSDYPASDGWALSYYLRKSGGYPVNITSEASDDNHLFDVTSSETMQWAAGEYTYQARVTDGSQTFTVGSGTIEILEDLSIQDANFDGRTEWQQIRDYTLAVLQGRASMHVLASNINGVDITNMSHEDILKLHDRAVMECQREQDEIDAAAGKSSRRNIKFRFSPLQ